MKEESFKFIIILFFYISNICFSLENNIYSYDFVHVDVTPIEVSKNNIGLRSCKINNEVNVFFDMEHWISNNLYFSGSLSPSSNNDINIIYNINFGYKTNLEFVFLKNIYFDIGYYSKRFESDSQDDFKWKTFSLISDFHFKKIIFLSSYTYAFDTYDNEKESNTHLSINFIRTLGESLFINFGIQIYDENKIHTLPFISLNYKI